MRCSRFVFFAWLAGFFAFLAGLVNEAQGGIALRELRARVNQFKRQLISLSTQCIQLGQLGMAERVGLPTSQDGRLKAVQTDDDGHAEKGVHCARPEAARLQFTSDCRQDKTECFNAMFCPSSGPVISSRAQCE